LSAGAFHPDEGTALLLTATWMASPGVARALGMMPYLPLNFDPEVENQDPNTTSRATTGRRRTS